MIHPRIQERLRVAGMAVAVEGPSPKRGEEIFGDGPYPRSWDQFIGQDTAIRHLKAVIASARARGTRPDHILLASGMGGVGKSSLARLIAYLLGVGFMELSGPVSVEEARAALRGMQNGDVLFLDEIHQLVTGGKGKAEWLLHLLQDGRLLTAAGSEPMPDVTIIGATTDAQRLPTTILGRFKVRPVLEAYTDEEALRIIKGMAYKLEFGSELYPMPPDDTLAALATAANNAPRDMTALLVAYRDTYYDGEPGFDINTAMAWAGVSSDGLNRIAQDYLLVLVSCEGKASLATIAGMLGEPGPLAHTENLLGQRGYITIESGGRRLTVDGVRRAGKLLHERGLAS
jgi:Holliday junction DNA helicase RuvB